VIAGPTAAEARRYRADGWWLAEPLGETIRRRAERSPDAVAYLGDRGPLTWREYDRAADALAARLASQPAADRAADSVGDRAAGSVAGRAAAGRAARSAAGGAAAGQAAMSAGSAGGWPAGYGLARGARVAVFLPDGPLLHVAYTACERAGVVIVGIPVRAGDRELAHLLGRTRAALLLCPPLHRGRGPAELAAAVRAAGGPAVETLSLDDDLDAGGPGDPVDFGGRQMRPDELWLVNSTSGTTGLPKCVRQDQHRWQYFVRLATGASGLCGDDVLMSVVPGPFGFGLWTAHFAPALLGAPCVLTERFDPAATLRAVAAHRVSVLACVTTQLIMLLADPALSEVDLCALRVVYTGGERLPPAKAREWERRTGSTVLQFYGSNEVGAFSGTTLADSEEQRLTTVGRVVPGLDHRLYGEHGRDVTEAGGPGQPAARGPGGGLGYWDDPAADAELVSPGGYLLLPDLVTVDTAGYVRIAGRKSDIIIRGGKNISAAAVEVEVGAHPAVAMAAAVAVPDEVFGERVCAVVSLRDGSSSDLSLADLVGFLAGRGVSKEYFPEYLVVLDELPQSIGGKIAKSELRARLPELLGRTP
jgi:acyl-CoA synthetase